MAVVPLDPPRRLFTITVDGVEDTGARGCHDPRRLSRDPGRHAHPLLRGQPHAGERVPRVRRGGRGRPHARAGLQPQGRRRHGGHDRHRARSALAHAGDGVPGVAASRWSSRAPTCTAGWTSTRRSRSGSAPRWSPLPAGERDAREPGHHHDRGSHGRRGRRTSRSRSTTSCTCGTTRAASSATSASRRAASTPRTRSRSRWPGGGSTRASPPSTRWGWTRAPASTAATASGSARPGR